MKTTATNLIRWAGLAAMGTGILFVVIQVIHPLDVLSSVTTPQWTIVHYLGIAMGLLGMLGITGIYARQVEETGWLGLAGFLLLGFFYALTTAFQFVEALISPVLATAAPQYVEGFLGIASGHATGFDLGALPLVYTITGLAGYLLGGVLFGIATFRAGVLPRWAGALLAFAVVLPFFTAPLIAHPYDRILAVPMAIALAWMGYALWSERRGQASEPVPGRANPQLRQAGAK
ncbi:MAG: hypothetical protein IT328_27580 [Caldilineaceae bacterium]|nr:hypothetical protein [Caldilineaceae bacterium]